VNERRTAWVLVAILAGQLLLLSLQAPAAAAGGGENFLESLVLRGVAPLAQAVSTTVGGFRSMGEDWRLGGRLAEENEALRRRVEELELEVMRLSDLEAEVDRLSGALDYSRTSERGLRVADVVYADHSSWFRTLILYVGDTPAALDQPVISEDGLVGRVIEVVPRYAKVQLITDRAAAVGAMVSRTRRQGVVRSGPRGLELDFLPQQADVRVGDRVVTSGIDGIYPRGLPIGVVTEVERGDELFYDLQLEPAVDFGVLDQVYLLEPQPIPDELD
jgi:rod shape-determining protein MreC